MTKKKKREREEMRNERKNRDTGRKNMKQRGKRLTQWTVVLGYYSRRPSSSSPSAILRHFFSAAKQKVQCVLLLHFEPKDNLIKSKLLTLELEKRKKKDCNCASNERNP